MKKFNAYEIFAIAEQIERNGGAFYRRAAETTNSPEARELFADLAEWEGRHEEYFRSLRERFGLENKEEFPDVDGQLEAYLDAVADGSVFVTATAAANLATITAETSPEDIIKIAIGFEKDAVVFFSSMKQLIPPSLGQEHVEALVLEELRHISLLVGMLG